MEAVDIRVGLLIDLSSDKGTSNEYVTNEAKCEFLGKVGVKIRK